MVETVSRIITGCLKPSTPTQVGAGGGWSWWRVEGGGHLINIKPIHTSRDATLPRVE